MKIPSVKLPVKINDPWAEAYGMSFGTTDIRRRLGFPDPGDVTGWTGFDFLRYDLYYIRKALGKIVKVIYKDE